MAMSMNLNLTTSRTPENIFFPKSSSFFPAFSKIENFAVYNNDRVGKKNKKNKKVSFNYIVNFLYIPHRDTMNKTELWWSPSDLSQFHKEAHYEKKIERINNSIYGFSTMVF